MICDMWIRVKRIIKYNYYFHRYYLTRISTKQKFSRFKITLFYDKLNIPIEFDYKSSLF